MPLARSGAHLLHVVGQYRRPADNPRQVAYCWRRTTHINSSNDVAMASIPTLLALCGLQISGAFHNAPMIWWSGHRRRMSHR
jgi:hypothetical protein